MSRVRPHFKAHLSITTHPKMAEVYGDNDLLACWLRLGITAMERFAGKTGGVFHVRDSELYGITGIGRADLARTCLRRLAHLGLICAEPHGDPKPQVWRIEWRNLPIKQGVVDKNVTGTAPECDTSESDSESDSEEEGERTPIPEPGGGSQPEANSNGQQRQPPPSPGTKESAGSNRRGKSGQGGSRTASPRRPAKEPETKAPEILTEREWTLAAAWAAGQAPPISAADLAGRWDECRDWHLKNGITRCDWYATLRSWVRKGREFQKERGDDPDHPRPQKMFDPNDQYTQPGDEERAGQTEELRRKHADEQKKPSGSMSKQEWLEVAK